MNRVQISPAGVVAAMALLALDAWSQPPCPTVLVRGHVPLEVLYQEGQWSFYVNGTESGFGRFPPEEAVYHFHEVNRHTIPPSEKFAFLGEPGDPVWIVSSVETAGSVELGISAERITTGLFVQDTFNLHLTGVEGPGDFALYTIDSIGQVTVFHNSRDGVTEEDVIPVAIGAHDHQNWAFNAPGHYRVSFRASATLSEGNQSIISPEVTYYFAVGDVNPVPPAARVVLDHGDTDIAAVMEGDELVLEAFSEVLDQAVRAECVVFQASPATRVAVPEDPAFAFLGEPGSSAWIMPQNEEEGKLFLALAAEDIPAGIFQNDSVRITLKEFEGPGNLFLYQTDAFGQPAFFFDTSDGVSDLDFRDLKAGEHYHMNWAFTAPGTYVLGLQASGVRVSSGQPIESEVTHFRFEVVSGERPVLTISRKDGQTVILSWDSSLSVLDQLQSRSASTAGSWENLGSAFTGMDGVRSVEVAIETGIATLFFRIHRRSDAPEAGTLGIELLRTPR